MKAPNLVLVEQCLWICEEKSAVPGYDFDFGSFFHCQHPIFLEKEVTAVARMGAAPDYQIRYESLLESNIRLIHSPEEYNRTSNLPEWYPLVESLTPKSKWYEEFPHASAVEADFDWPIFVKGERQTSKHDRSSSIIESRNAFEALREVWMRSPILHWQKVVCREFLDLKKIVPDNGQTMPKAFEFRTFWWKNTCVGIGPYWHAETYQLSESQRKEIITLGRKVAEALDVTFLVIDVAMKTDGEWILIECNDGQDSGFTGVNPFRLWNDTVSAIQQQASLS